jgi:hydrogenase/urease accessory protein HupE
VTPRETRPRGTTRSFGAAVLVAVGFVCICRSAWAHAIGFSKGEYRRTDDGLAVELTFAREEVEPIMASLGRDFDTDAARGVADASRARAALKSAVVERIRVGAGAVSCPGEVVEVAPTESDGLSLRASYRCPNAGSLSVHLDFLEALSHGHRHAAHVVSGALVSNELLFTRRAEFEVKAATPLGDGGKVRPVLGFLRMGVEHILGGYDHLVFLFALVVVGARLGSLLWVVTAFTAAHSVSLALSALGLFSPSARLVEPAIALSIAWVGAENLFARRIEKRWRVTFPFGLVHGFGFAGALTQVGLSRAEVPMALVMFNLGVELGQIGLLALFVPIVWRLHRFDWFGRRVVPALSCCVVIAGTAWFVERVGVTGPRAGAADDPRAFMAEAMEPTLSRPWLR